MCLDTGKSHAMEYQLNQMELLLKESAKKRKRVELLEAVLRESADRLDEEARERLLKIMAERKAQLPAFFGITDQSSFNPANRIDKEFLDNEVEAVAG